MSAVIAATLVAAMLSAGGCDGAPRPEVVAAPVEEMRFVPGATFRMGTNAGELERIRLATGLATTRSLLAEVPAHDVTVGGFHLDTYDVTNRWFAGFVEVVPDWDKSRADRSLHNGRYLEHWPDGRPRAEQLDHPVTFVTWQAAVAYCEWRGKRLPTEAEYEWAAQDGETGAEYPWGDTPPADDLVSWGGNGIDTTVPVGSYAPNARGLYDMAGNVWRFTADPWVGTYAEMLADPGATGRHAADPGTRRVVRGGSWGANAANLRVRYRDSHRPFDAREMVGFRCARSAPAG